MHKWLAVTGMIAALTIPPGECTRLAPDANPCKLDPQGYYVVAPGCAVSKPEPRRPDKNCADQRQPCHYTRPANVSNSAPKEKEA